MNKLAFLSGYLSKTSAPTPDIENGDTLQKRSSVGAMVASAFADPSYMDLGPKELDRIRKKHPKQYSKMGLGPQHEVALAVQKAMEASYPSSGIIKFAPSFFDQMVTNPDGSGITVKTLRKYSPSVLHEYQHALDNLEYPELYRKSSGSFIDLADPRATLKVEEMASASPLKSLSPEARKYAGGRFAANYDTYRTDLDLERVRSIKASLRDRSGYLSDMDLDYVSRNFPDLSKEQLASFRDEKEVLTDSYKKFRMEQLRNIGNTKERRLAWILKKLEREPDLPAALSKRDYIPAIERRSKKLLERGKPHSSLNETASWLQNTKREALIRQHGENLKDFAVRKQQNLREVLSRLGERDRKYLLSDYKDTMKRTKKLFGSEAAEGLREKIFEILGKTRRLAGK